MTCLLTRCSSFFVPSNLLLSQLGWIYLPIVPFFVLPCRFTRVCSSDLVSCIPLFKNFIFFVELFAILQLIGSGSCADELELPDSEAAAVTLGQ